MLLVGTAVVDGARRTRDARAELSAARVELDAARAILRPLIALDTAAWPEPAAFAEARTRLDTGAEHLARGRARLGYLRPLAPLARWVPYWGGSVADGGEALDLAYDAASASERLLATLSPLLDDSPEPMVAAAREVFVTRHAAVDRDLAVLERVGARAGVLAGRRWRPPLDTAGGLLADIADDLAPVAQTRADLAVVSPAIDRLLGYGRPTTYLVIGQNDHEVRPTGGFIGSIARVVVDAGHVQTHEYSYSYDLDPVGVPPREAPYPMQVYLGIQPLYLRDANWSPHFPESARTALDILAADQGMTFDIVLAVDSTMVGLLLDAVGPIAVDGIAEPLTRENWFEQVERSIFGDPAAGDSAREAYLGPILRELTARLEHLDRAQLPRALEAFRQGIAGRHLQLYAPDAAVQAAFHQLDADGALRPPAEHDFLAVVDANVSYSKIQPAIRRTITYLRRGDAVDVVVEWTNDPQALPAERYLRMATSGGLWDPIQRAVIPHPGLFGNWTRIYLSPAIAEVGARGFDSLRATERTAEAAVVSGFVPVEPGQQRRVVLSYTYPPGTAPPRLVVWKQGGLTETHLRVLVADGDEQATVFDGPLVADLDLDVRAAASPTAPAGGADGTAAGGTAAD